VISVSCFDETDVAAPHGDFKQSGFGRHRSLHAITKHPDSKTV